MERTSGPVAPLTHHLTLRFRAREWEWAFREDYVRSGLALLRVAIAVGGVLAAGLGLRSRAGALDLPTLGLVVGLPLLLNGLTMWATFTRWFFRYAEWVVGASMVGWGFIYAVWIAAEPDETAATGALFAIAMVALYAFVIVRAGLVAGVVASLTAGLAIVAAIFATGALPPERAVLVGNAAAAWLLAAVAGYFVERYARRDFVHRRLLDAERARSEALLLNVLPAPIAARLKEGEEPIADAHAAVTVLFADVVDFTVAAARCTPEEMVRTLNAAFSAFDALARRHGLEKIKTIGDAYMVAGGLPAARPNHAAAVAEMALDMLAAVEGLTVPTGDPLRLRIGIDSGPAVAGVIGTAKFAYDLWGDTVNTAARMESHGVPGKVQVTQAAYEELRARYAFESRGVIDVKGKGPMPVYLLLGRHGTAAEPEQAVGATAARGA